MNRSPRVKIQPTKFTPTQSSKCSAQNYLLRFEDNDELIITKRSSIRSIIEDQAIVGIGKNRRTATVEAKGTYSQCNAIYEDLISCDNDDTNNQEDEIDEVEEDDLSSDENNQNQTQINPPLTQKRKLASLTTDDNDEEFNNNIPVQQQNVTTNQKRRRLLDQPISDKNDIQAHTNANGTDSSELHILYQTIDDMRHTIMNGMEQKFKAFTKTFDRRIPLSVDQNLDFYREKEEVFPATVMYNGKDLLTIRGRDMYDFARQTLRVLYTSQELNNSVLPPGRKHLVRPPLDIERFNIFHEAVRVKYRISALHYDSCYSKLIKPRMCDFLIDERKRQAKGLLRQSTTVEPTQEVVL